METHVARNEQGRVLRWCSHCQGYTPTISSFVPIVFGNVRRGLVTYCEKCAMNNGTSKMINYE